MTTLNNFIPDFIIIGAGKAGTTSLTSYLDQHPAISMSSNREPNFFIYEGQEGVSAVTDWDSYRQSFTHASQDQKLGEASPMYLHHPEAAKKMKHYVPNVKLIAILRHPTDRLYSRYMQLVRKGAPPTNDLESIFDHNSIWWSRNDLIAEGFYFENLMIYINTFGEENISIFLYDDYVNNPNDMYSQICHFIGVSDSYKPDFSVKLNQSGKIKNKFLDDIIGVNSHLKYAFKTNFPNIFKRIRSKGIVIKQLNKVRRLNLDNQELPSELRKHITNDVYSEDIIKLQQLIKRDLSYWLE